MANSPRTREFYRPLVEDLHEAAREWRGSFSRLHLTEILLIAAVLLAAPILLVGLVHYSESTRFDIPANPAPGASRDGPIQLLEARGARFGRNLEGYITQATLQGAHFTDRDMRDLSMIPTLESITLIDANVTNDGLMALRFPRLKHLELINTAVTKEAAAAYPGMIGPANIEVRVIRESGENVED